MMSDSLFLLSYMAQWLLTLVLLAAVLCLYRHFGAQLLERERLRNAAGPELNEELAFTFLANNGAGRPGSARVTVFTAAGCPACERVKPVLEHASKAARAATIVAVHRADAKATDAYFSAIGPFLSVVADPNDEVARAWRIPGTPFFVATNDRGQVVRKGMASTKKDLEAYFAAAASSAPASDSRATDTMLAQRDA